jgi:RHH-type rel operon transcriptional repressor/antitoxin RelB
MPATANISADIPEELSAMLTTVAKAEERSKSYYVRKGLENFLQQRLEDLEDYQDAKKAYDEFIASGEEGVPFEEVFQNVK